ncbi:MAG: hypothetical protein J2O38_07520, partial [Acidimicrobiales bacterium]|nr:hypothetical protein [Acidimicrobiales bacterium]
PGFVDFLFLDRPVVEETAWDKVMGDPVARAILQDAAEAYRSASWDAGALHRITEEVGQRHGRKLARAQAPVRVAVTGRTVGPPLFESLQLLGREQVLARLGDALDRLGEQGGDGGDARDLAG